MEDHVSNAEISYTNMEKYFTQIFRHIVKRGLDWTCKARTGLDL